jgi:hypothetical protein
MAGRKMLFIQWDRVMNAVEIVAVALIIAAGWGLSSAEIGYPGMIQNGDLSPVGKCRGLCRIPRTGFPAGVLLTALAHPCAGEQTARSARGTVLTRSYQESPGFLR